MTTYQLTLEGFNPRFSYTDHLIKWVNAPSLDALQWYIAKQQWVLQCPAETPFDRVLEVKEGVDAILDEDGNAITPQIDSHFSGVNVTPETAAISEAREEELFETFRTSIRVGVLNALDDLLEKKGVPSDNPYRTYLLGARDEDLSALFPALDAQAALLWARGAREHTLKTSS